MARITAKVKPDAWDVCECGHDYSEHGLGDGGQCIAIASSGFDCSCPSFKLETE